MNPPRSLQSAWGLLFLRVGASAMLFGGHGLDKLFNMTERAGTFPDPVGLGPAITLFFAVFAELVCTLFVAAGLATRLSLLPILATLLVTVLMVHGPGAWQQQEVALLYALPFLTIMFIGPGDFSMDALRHDREAVAAHRRLHRS